MMCHPRIPDNSMIRAIKAEGDTRGRRKRKKFTQDFSRKNCILGRYRSKWIRCDNVKWIRLTQDSPVEGGSLTLGDFLVS